jgi:hypothetical protein
MGFKRFWDHVSREWMVSRRAAIAFGLAAGMTCLVTLLLLRIPETSKIGAFGNFLCGTIGILGAVGMFFLWGGMLKFLEMVEQGRGRKSTIWRATLLVGVWNGAVVYYFLVYLPTRAGMSVALNDPSRSSNPPPPRIRSRKLGAFGYVLVLAWGAFGLFIVCLFVFQNAYKLVQPIAPYFALVPLFLMLFTALYALVRFITGKP